MAGSPARQRAIAISAARRLEVAAQVRNSAGKDSPADDRVAGTSDTDGQRNTSGVGEGAVEATATYGAGADGVAPRTAIPETPALEVLDSRSR